MTSSLMKLDNVVRRESATADGSVLEEFLSKRLRGEDIPIESAADDDNNAVDGNGLSTSSSSGFCDECEVMISEVDADGDLILDHRSRHQTGVTDDDNDNKSTDKQQCCDCTNCTCSCHVNDQMFAPDLERPIDSYVVYLFDYELFNVPQNYNKFEILYDYLNEERIFDRSYVVSVATDTRRDDYLMYERGSRNRNVVESRLERSEIDSNVLRYRPSIVESIDETRNDVRQRFRGLVVQGSRYDWFTVKSVLNYPAFIIYVRVLNSKNDLPAVDHTIIVDPSHKTFISSPGTHGLKIARILAHTRTKYFGIDHFNFSHLLEQANLRILQRAASKK